MALGISHYNTSWGLHGFLYRMCRPGWILGWLIGVIVPIGTAVWPPQLAAAAAPRAGLHPAVLPLQVMPSKCTTLAPSMTAVCLTRHAAESRLSSSSERERCVDEEVVGKRAHQGGVRRGWDGMGEETHQEG